MASRLLCLALCLANMCQLGMWHLHAQTTSSEKMTVGSVDYFGYGNLDLVMVQSVIPIHEGSTISEQELQERRTEIHRSIQRSTGNQLTDVAVVCCSANNQLMIYIGLAGSTYHPQVSVMTPKGKQRLADPALLLYEAFGTAMENAISKGASKEDWSPGYALSEDSAVRTIQMKMRSYAIEHGHKLETVLRGSADSKQRIASAFLLGYAKSSNHQIQSLANASRDSVQEVRNNAVRSLVVLANAKKAPTFSLDVKPLLDMVYSGDWTDRNKVSLLLDALTRHQNPHLLDQLRLLALPALIEGAKWKNIGHAGPFLRLLARLEGLPESYSDEWLENNRQQIIQTAMASLSGKNA